jgi:hypothetical protein
MPTSNDIANQALQLIGDNMPIVTGEDPTWDSSPAGVALQKLYSACVQAVGRQFQWDMARNTVQLVLTGNVAPFPWSFEYAYPPNGIEVWQLLPNQIPDINNPLPYDWQIANGIVAGAQGRVVWSNLANAFCTYNNNPNENTWDSLFRETVVRLLSSELAMAVAGKPDIQQSNIEASMAFEKIGEGREW